MWFFVLLILASLLFGLVVLGLRVVVHPPSCKVLRRELPGVQWIEGRWVQKDGSALGTQTHPSEANDVPQVIDVDYLDMSEGQNQRGSEFEDRGRNWK